MARTKKRNLSGIQKWIDSRQGQIFLNFAYSWGAAIVILGALFKLTHISGANLMLFLGMGTEVLVFFISGFERPWDGDDEETAAENPASAAQAAGPVVIGAPAQVSGPIIIGGGNVAAVSAGDVPAEQVAPVAEAASAQPVDAAVLAGQLASQMASAPAFSSPQFAGMTPEMQEATQAYVEQLNELTQTLKLVAEQSARLTRDSEEMETMNRTLTGINRFYEMQLRSVSAQSSTIDEVHEQTKRLAEQLEELNSVYARMVEALKVNIK
jgi:gliding motility-associated protein GldL